MAAPISMSLNPASLSILSQPAHGRPPAIHPVQRSMSRITSSGTGLPFAMSANCILPPGRSTRSISENIRLLSAQRLITPLPITTSAHPSPTGRSSINPSRNPTWVRPISAPPPRAQIDHPLPFQQGAQGKGIRHPGERLNRRLRERCDDAFVVPQPGCERPPRVEVKIAARIHGHLAVLLLHLLAQCLGIYHHLESHMPSNPPAPGDATRRHCAVHLQTIFLK